MTDVAWLEVLLRSNQPDRHMGSLKEYLVPGTRCLWMFGETPLIVMVWSYPTETSILKWMFGVPGTMH